MISAVLKENGHHVNFFDTSRFRENGQTTDTLERQTKKMEEALQFIPVELPPIEKINEFAIEALHSEIESLKPGLIGFTATSSDFPQVVTILKQIGKYRIPVIVGGAHATVAPLETLAVDGVDMVCVGEGEQAILELADDMDSGGHRTDILNIYFKKGSRIIKNGIRPYSDLNSLPFPDLDIFDEYHHVGAYQGKQVIYGRFETARGCPYKCAYCINKALHGIYSHEKRHIRFKSPERVIDELKYGMEKIGFDIFRFVDETFTATPVDRLTEFVDLYRKEIDKPMIIATRPERVNHKIMGIIREAHKNIQVTMGIESGSEDIRKKVCNRHMSNQTIIKAYDVCHEMGFHTASFNMIGLPDETREDFLQTIRLNREARVDQPMLSFFYPFPGTKLRDYCIKNGYLDEELHEIDYAVSSVLAMPQFTNEEIEGLKRTFVLYVKMDESFFPKIEKAERDNAVFQKMVALYNKDFFSTKTPSANTIDPIQSRVKDGETYC